MINLLITLAPFAPLAVVTYQVLARADDFSKITRISVLSVSRRSPLRWIKSADSNEI